MPTIYRGTTPTITCTVEMDLTDYSCYLAIGARAKSPYVVVDNEQMTLSVENDVSTLAYTLTQEQTLSCYKGKAYIQLRLIKDNVAIASDWCELEIGDIIKDGEIVDEYDTN